MAASKTVTIKLKEQITIKEVPEARTILVGLHAANGNDQRVITLHEPGMVKFIDLQTKAAELDQQLPPAPVPDDPQNPTGEEIEARQAAAREQAAFLYSKDRPYGRLFLDIVTACTDEKVTEEELPTWALTVEGCRRVLDFYKSLSPGPDVAAVLAAIQPQGPS